MYNKLIHKRLGHAGVARMAIMHKRADEVKQMLTMKPHDCKVCSEMKATTAPISKKPIPKASKALEKIHIDDLGPFPKSVRGYQYGCMITDSYTNRHWVLLCKHKSDSHNRLVEWVKEIEASISAK